MTQNPPEEELPTRDLGEDLKQLGLHELSFGAGGVPPPATQHLTTTEFATTPGAEEHGAGVPRAGVPGHDALETSDSAPEQVRLRAIARPRYLVLAGVLVCAMLGGAFYAGTQIRPPAASRTDETPLPVTAQVAKRVVQDSPQHPAKVVPPEKLALKLAGDGALGSTPPAPAAREGAPQQQPQQNSGGVTEQGNASAEQQASQQETAQQEGTPQQEAAPLSERNVVTRSVAAPGDVLEPGDLLAEISGRPVLAVAPGTPLFRDLSVGLTGADVLEVQIMLNSLGYPLRENGTLGQDTMNALVHWYEQRGYPAPRSSGANHRIPWRELLALPPGRLTVVGAIGVGTVVSAETGIVDTERGDPTLETTVDPVQVAEFPVGARVFLSAGGHNYPATVLSVGNLETNKDTNVSSHRVVVTSPPESREVSNSGGFLTLSATAPREPSLAVPVTALKEDSQGQFVLLATEPAAEDGSERKSSLPTAANRAPSPSAVPEERVNVTVITVSGGWAAIEATERLTEGTAIRVR